MRGVSRPFVALLAAVALSGCIQSTARLQAGLERAGLSTPMSACVATRMTDQLSLVQLRRIGALGNLRDDAAAGMSLDRFLYNIRSLGDPEILTVASTSAAACALTSR